MHGFIEACIFQDREQYLPYSDVSLCMLYIHQYLKSYISYATNNNKLSINCVSYSNKLKGI